jgi:NADPH:quinone reductase-like Zn-dependent oxidoreductase
MKAIVYTDYGPPDVLQLKEINKPTPEKDEVLIKVHAASINYVDWHVLKGESLLLRLMNGIRKPKHNVLGDDVAGQVEEVGSNVKHFQPGDEVFGISANDAFAEFACVKEEYLAVKPANISFEEAAAVPYAGVTAVVGLRDKGQIQSRQTVLINGASGGVGTFAVQIAKSFGAEVTGVCSSNKVNMVRSIGADHVIDYTQVDVTRSGRRYDFIFDVAAHRSIFDYRRILNPAGIYVLAGGSMTRFLQAMLVGPLISMTGGEKLGTLGWAKPNRGDFVFMAELLETGKVVPVIDRCYPLSEVPQALQYYGDGHTKGKIIITVEQSDNCGG